MKFPARICEYEITNERVNGFRCRFWPVKVRGFVPQSHTGIEFLLGASEQVANMVRYDDTERMTKRWEESVREALQERGDTNIDITIMLFKLPSNDRNVEYVAYDSFFITTIHP